MYEFELLMCLGNGQRKQKLKDSGTMFEAEYYEPIIMVRMPFRH